MPKMITVICEYELAFHPQKDRNEHFTVKLTLPAVSQRNSTHECYLDIIRKNITNNQRYYIAILLSIRQDKTWFPIIFWFFRAILLSDLTYAFSKK